MHVGLEFVGADRSGRPWYLLAGGDLTAWNIPASARFEQFTTFLALNAGRYTDEEVSALGERLRAAGLAYLCAWGPACGRVHFLFDLVQVDEWQSGIRRSFLMTTDHEDEPLAEALWWALEALGEDVQDLSNSAVVIGADRDDWRREIQSWLGDVDELRRYVVEDLPG